MDRIYLDYAATTPVDKEVEKAMRPFRQLADGCFGNPNSLHYFGQEARKAADQAREKIAKIIGAEFDEVIFTGSATEANNLALRGTIKKIANYSPRFGEAGGLRINPSPVGSPFRKGRITSPQPSPWKGEGGRGIKILVSAIEHESVMDTARDLAREGVEIGFIPVNKYGVVDLKKLKEMLDEKTALVSVMHVNNETGAIQPIKEISKIISDCKKEKASKGILSHYPLLHADAVQAFSYLRRDVGDLGVDMMTLSAHKIYGPKGIGVLYMKKNEISGSRKRSYFISPIITGGGQEFGLRSGTENVSFIVGTAKAMEIANENRDKEFDRVIKLRNYFHRKILNSNLRMMINNDFITKPDLYAPHIINLSFPDKNPGDILIALDMNGVAVSAGSACASYSARPSYVLKAMGVSGNRLGSAIRISMGRFTTKDEIDRATKIIKMILK